jgi:hypothetical protein
MSKDSFESSTENDGIEPSDGITRRTTLAALGIAGIGLVGGSTASADTGDSPRSVKDQDEKPPRSWQNDVDANEHDLSNVDTLGADEVLSPAFLAETTQTNGNIVDRPLVSNGQIELYVDPDGSDSADGSEADPLATLQAAFDRLPFILQHSTTIHVTEGVNTNDGPSLSSGRHIVNHMDGEKLRIVGDSDNPENHVIGSPDSGSGATPHRVALGFMSTVEQCEIEGITFNAQVEPFASTLSFKNCIFNASPETEVASAIAGSSSLTRLDNCEVGPAGTTDHLIEISAHQNFQFKDSTIEANKSVLLGEDSGGIVSDIGGNDVTAPFWINDVSESVITVRGHAEIGLAGGDGSIPTGSFDVIVLEEGEHRAYYLDDGEQFENVLIDQRAPDSSFTIRSEGKADWAIRNVGFLGTGQVGESEGVFQMTLDVPEGETGVVENVYMDARGPNLEGSDTEIGGLYARASHAGHIEVRNTFIAGMGNNAAYMSATGKDGHSNGSASFTNCYHRDNTVSQFRIGAPNSSVRNCVGIVNDPDGLRGVYPDTDSQRARCVWGRHFENQLVENSSFYYSPDDVQRSGSQAFHAQHFDRSNGERAELVLKNCDINEDVPDGELFQEDGNAEVVLNDLGNEPTMAVLMDGGGVPTSAEMAASGERGYSSPDSIEGIGVQYNDDAVAVKAEHYPSDEKAGVEFMVSNNVAQELTITHVTITPNDSSINELHDEDGGVGKWVSELHIAADVQEGVLDVPGSGPLPNRFDMGNDGWSDEADSVAIMSGESTGRVAFSRFEADGDPVDMAGEQVDVKMEFEFSDGATGTSTFTLDIE